MPDKTRKTQALREIECTSTPPDVANTSTQQNIRITEVLIAVARFESIPDTPILASRAVTPAKKADAIAQKNHCIRLASFGTLYAPERSKASSLGLSVFNLGFKGQIQRTSGRSPRTLPVGSQNECTPTYRPFRAAALAAPHGTTGSPVFGSRIRRRMPGTRCLGLKSNMLIRTPEY
jgi:hypothetical protein